MTIAMRFCCKFTWIYARTVQSHTFFNGLFTPLAAATAFNLRALHTWIRGYPAIIHYRTSQDLSLSPEMLDGVRTLGGPLKHVLSCISLPVCQSHTARLPSLRHFAPSSFQMSSFSKFEPVLENVAAFPNASLTARLQSKFRTTSRMSRGNV